MERCVKRIMLDIKEIQSDPDPSFFYIPDETNALKGHAIIIGREGTPYAHGFYLFEFVFPTNYPFSPPVVTFLNGDGRTRFNPNLYVSGKVCLSILNTWSGEKWSACQSIRSVLLSISILILNEEPFLNEPGIARTHCSFKPYHQLLEYKNIEVCILKYLRLEQVPTVFQSYHPMFVSYFVKHYDQIIDVLKKENTFVDITVFEDQICFLNYLSLEQETRRVYDIVKIDINN